MSSSNTLSDAPGHTPAESTPDAVSSGSTHPSEQPQLTAAIEARKASRQLSQLRGARSRWLGAGLSAGIILAGLLAVACWRDSYWTTRGEPFSLVSGTSVWPTEWLRLLACALALFFVAEGHSRLRTSVLEISRRFCLPLAGAPASSFWTLPSAPAPTTRVNITTLWQSYQQMGCFWQRVRRLVFPAGLYVMFGFGLIALGDTPRPPVRGTLASVLDMVLLCSSVLTFLILVFWTLDAVRLCRWFVEHLSESPTIYPMGTLERFGRLRATEDTQLLDEWLDLQLVADLTERVGRLVYYPFIVLFLIIVARNNWWDSWTWPWPLVVILTANLLLCVTALLILQRVAHRARDAAIHNLEAKWHQRLAAKAESPKHHAADEAERLLDEIRGLRRGALVPFWESPVIGALLVPSGGTALIELTAYLLGR